MVDGTGKATITGERLSQIWLFASPDIPTEELKRLADSFQTRHVSPGEFFYKHDDDADTMWILVQGQCQVGIRNRGLL